MYFKIEGVFVVYLLAIFLWIIKNIRPLLLCLLFDFNNLICSLQGFVSFNALLGFELSGIVSAHRVSANRSKGQAWCLSSGIRYFFLCAGVFNTLIYTCVNKMKGLETVDHSICFT